MMKVDILAIGVHPDDVELSCAGTVLKHVALGKKVALLDLTKGELGTRGSGELRLQEAAKASEILGIVARENVGLADGFFQYSEENIRKIIPFIRKFQPEIVLANALNDRHPDHGRAAKLTADACFYAGLAKIETFDENGNPQERWRPKAIYHYVQDYLLEPDVLVDISGFMDKKMEAIMAYSSQFFNPSSKDLATPISGKDFVDSINNKCQIWGRLIGTQYAEGYNVNRTIGVHNLFDLL